MPPTKPLPLVVLSGVRRTELDLASLGLAWSLPSAVVVRHELHVEEGYIRRVVSDSTGVLEDVPVTLDHTCLTCALRLEVLPKLVRLARAGRWSFALLILPEAAEPLPLVRAVQHSVVEGRPAAEAVEVRSVVAAFDPGRLLEDVFGDVLVEEEDGERHPGDRRALGEVRAQQLEFADVLLATGGDWSAEERALLDELRRPGSLVADDGSLLDAAALLAAPRDAAAADAFVDPTARRPFRTPEATGGEIRCDASAATDTEVWTLYVDTWRPFHPGRLMDELEAVGGNGMRGRGCFWLPTRPNAVAVWDGAGGQLSIGTTGTWDGRTPRTRLVITGLGDEQQDVAQAVERALMTETELDAGLDRWAGRDDGFDAWLGDYSEVA